ncbi:hypothetical protein [Nitratifractor salsuginis]|uniref:Uncharacterized protein n=1 Tax=Nitratifractor salsuginis (strain DSM 16511 / JCM 12458 / E9I37-1) TaxID=749222 RepID=E6X1N1_NITSE|nr:hypothetical protein [Nitratifractor salsuginis]ADV47022.1 hypothetical protein Nitsa_1777 [Nitratifractor salsuginis DSM 16511]
MNLVDLQQKIDNYVSVVSSWVRNVGKLYFSSTPENVDVKLIDDSGAVVTRTMPNVAQFRKRVWDDVGGALGQFDRTFYVDAANGSDDNDGSSGTPFQTIKKACDSVPVGGHGRIVLREKQTHYIAEGIVTTNKILEFATWMEQSDSNDNAWIENIPSDDGNGNTRTTGFIQKGGCHIFGNVNIRTANYADGTTGLSIIEGLYRRADNGTYNTMFYDCAIELGDTNLIHVPTGPNATTHAYLYGSEITRNGPNRDAYLIQNDAGSIVVNTHASSYKLSDGSDGSLVDFVAGQIVKDANGVPLNIVSNVSFE